jgi:hypothetical protein
MERRRKSIDRREGPGARLRHGGAGDVIKKQDKAPETRHDIIKHDQSY